LQQGFTVQHSKRLLFNIKAEDETLLETRAQKDCTSRYDCNLTSEKEISKTRQSVKVFFYLSIQAKIMTQNLLGMRDKWLVQTSLVVLNI
jgi:hypothetical protein